MKEQLSFSQDNQLNVLSTRVVSDSYSPNSPKIILQFSKKDHCSSDMTS